MSFVTKPTNDSTTDTTLHEQMEFVMTGGRGFIGGRNNLILLNPVFVSSALRHLISMCVREREGG